MPLPLVSVILPTRNRRTYLQLAIESVLDQSLSDFELIIVDDASSDDTSSVVAEACRQDPRVVAIRLDQRSGCNRARNAGLDVSRAPFISMLDDDDLYLPDRLSDSLAGFDRFPEVPIVAVDYTFMDANGNVTSRREEAPEPPSGMFGADRLFEALYCDWVWFPSSTLTFRRRVFDQVRYPSFAHSDGDNLMLSQLAALGNGCCKLESRTTVMRRDRAYEYMSRDRGRLLDGREQSIKALRRWLAQNGIDRFDHLRRRADATLLLAQARYLGGFAGLARWLSAVVRSPLDGGTWAYVRDVVASRTGR